MGFAALYPSYAASAIRWMVERSETHQPKVPVNPLEPDCFMLLHIQRL
jgi:hypothetical protein